MHLQQVLLNLILNGMDALNGAAADDRRVRVTVRRDGGQAVEIAVSDAGPGIPAEALAHVFDPFFTTKPNGMGMGLAISRTIIEAHGGRIWAENTARRRRGVSFHAADRSRGRCRMTTTAPTVHIVDDDASFLAATSRLLRASGFAVKTFASASGVSRRSVERGRAGLRAHRYADARHERPRPAIGLGAVAQSPADPLSHRSRRHPFERPRHA